MRFVSIAAMSLLASAPALATGDKLPPDRMPSEMTPTEIKAYTADIARNHPYYITCRKTEVMGSLVKKQRVCRTNEQWKVATSQGNQDTRDMVEGFARSGGSNGN